MYSYIARQPIFDKTFEVFGYELLYRDGFNNAFPSESTSGITQKMFVEQFLTYQNILLDKKLGFVNFDYDDLINRLPLDFPKSDYVIEVLETCEPDKYLFQSLVSLKNKGYTIALDDFCISDIRWVSFIEIADIIKIDIQAYPLKKSKYLVDKLKELNKLLLAEKVETYDEYKEAKSLGFDYFQGYFLSKPQVIRTNKLEEYFSVNIELIQELNKDSFSVHDIEKIISKSTTLILMLLNYVNSQVSVRKKISSINQAIAYLGKQRLKRFSAHLIMSTSPTIKPSILIKTSLYRAYFLKSIAKNIHGNDMANKAYIMGMLSMLDVILEMNFSDIFSNLNLDENISSAIMSHNGDLGELLLLVKSLEQGDWEFVGNFQLKHYEISPSVSHQYMNTIAYVNELFE
ncbi:EAL and HDOD domain-containing protein [Vibrio diazotrophicus]|uniref:EAL and HDOD domain-containing protein n=1 Tax=Vibrio diazotrophicus TaxID=685 RepID=UPI003D2F74B7